MYLRSFLPKKNLQRPEQANKWNPKKNWKNRRINFLFNKVLKKINSRKKKFFHKIRQYLRHSLYFIKLKLDQLLACHAFLGNHVSKKYAPLMLNYIVATRNNMYIFDTTLALISMQNILNSLYYSMKFRSVFLVLLGAVAPRVAFHYSFIEWLPGFLSNYHRRFYDLRRMLKRSRISRRDYRIKMQFRNLLNDEKVPFGMPKVSLSLIDSYAWLEECNSLGIKTLGLIDSLSIRSDMLDASFVGNQNSLPFCSLLLKLLKEVLFSVILDERLLRFGQKADSPFIIRPLIHSGSYRMLSRDLRQLRFRKKFKVLRKISRLGKKLET